MKPIAIALCLVLAACQPAAPVIQTCIPVTPWTPEQQRQILDAEKALPSDSILIPVLMDYSALRAQARACR